MTSKSFNCIPAVPACQHVGPVLATPHLVYPFCHFFKLHVAIPFRLGITVFDRLQYSGIHTR